MTKPSSTFFVIISLLITALIACSSDEVQIAAPAPADAAQAADAAPAKAEKAPPLRPEYDEKGLLVPHPRRLALGVAFPRGFERIATEKGVVIYRGAIRADKVRQFYHNYLDCTEVVTVAKGWRFKRALPRAPGDRTRVVDVIVTELGRQHSTITVFDRMGTAEVKAPPTDGKIKTYDDLVKAAHGGSGRKIPGTY